MLVQGLAAGSIVIIGVIMCYTSSHTIGLPLTSNVAPIRSCFSKLVSIVYLTCVKYNKNMLETFSPFEEKLN